jgi:putative tricarboxylic transport membrane protein
LAYKGGIIETFHYWIQGFSVATSPANLLYALIGCIMGTLIGVLPGLGPAAGTAILIPITFSLDPIGGIIMLAAIYYGAMYGGTITYVLVNVPGEAASVVTCLDGYQMAKQGRAGPALGIAAIGSFIGGMFATFALMVVAMPLVNLALRFGAPEIFALLVMGMCLVTGLSGRSLLAALIMTVFGLMLAMIGMDPVRGAPRYTFGLEPLYDGVGFVPVVMGLFGVGEILVSMEAPVLDIIKTKFSDLLPNRKEWGRSAGAIGRGTIIGFLLGLIPGMGAVIPTFVAYIVEKKVSKHPEKFGTGVIEGVASPETANNAYANASMVPLLTLGIPGSPTLALLMGAFMIHGLTPGPLLFKERPDVVWGLIASLCVGNVILLILNLPLVGLWARLLRIRYQYLYPGILLFCILGSYSLNQSVFDVGVMVVFGVLGYLFRKLDWPLAPTVLALVLGPMMERTLRTSLETSGGDFGIFLRRPIAAVLLVLTALILLTPAVRVFGKKAGKDDGG